MQKVTIPSTKLEDISGVTDGEDCSVSNLAATFQSNGYKTGVIGKWHLQVPSSPFNYTKAQEDVRSCGFHYAEALYPENLNGVWTQDYGAEVNIDHNMEHVTSKALEFVKLAVEGDNGAEERVPFFLYLNPTVPHDSGNVKQVLEEYDCKDTVEGKLDSKPSIEFGPMAANPDDDDDCGDYRKTVLDRAVSGEDKELGMIWIDDAIGSIIEALEYYGQMNNTFFLFQMDHGQEGKGSLFEPGIRIAQFVRYPDAFGIDGAVFDGLVSTIDIGPTMLDYAEIESPYDMDGDSWKSAVDDIDEEDNWKERCLAFEMDNDRAIRCGCTKFVSIGRNSGTESRAEILSYVLAGDNFYDLCADNSSPEADGTDINSFAEDEMTGMINMLECFLQKTNPGEEPDYSTNCWDDEEVEELCLDVQGRVIPHDSDGGVVNRDCAWVGGGMSDRCEVYGEYCPETCSLCPLN